MIFLIEKVENRYEVLVYQNLSDFAQRVEWQDIFEGNSIIADIEGNQYRWDNSKAEEYATIHNYTLVKTGEKIDFIERIIKAYESTNYCEEFELNI